MANVGPLMAETGSRVYGTPANFNGFHILLSLLQQHLSPETNQALHNVWLSPGLIHHIYTFGGSCSLTEFCRVQNFLYVKVLRSPILAALLHSSPAAGVSQTAVWYKEWNYGTFAEGATYIRLVAITFCIGPHSCSVCVVILLICLFGLCVRWLKLLIFLFCNIVVSLCAVS